MKILITGATGFIGSNLIKRLSQEKIDIFTIVRNAKKIDFFEEYGVKYYLDDGNIDALIDFFYENNFDGVIHLASCFLTKHQSKDINELINSNVLYSTRILEAASKTNVNWFINTGTFWQNYNNEKYLPVNLYAATKQAFLSIAKFYIETSNLKFVTLKLNDTFGPGDTRKKIVSLWNNISITKEILKMSPGEQLIDIVYIDDVIEAYIKLLELLQKKENVIQQNDEFVVTSNKRCTLKELAKKFEKATNKKMNILWGELPYREREVMIPYKNGKTVPGWEAKVEFEDGIKKMISDGLKD